MADYYDKKQVENDLNQISAPKLNEFPIKILDNIIQVEEEQNGFTVFNRG